MIVIQTCLCGGTGEVKKISEQDGNCHHDGWFIECECGIRTKVCSSYFFETEDKCIKEASRIWNDHYKLINS